MARVVRLQTVEFAPGVGQTQILADTVQRLQLCPSRIANGSEVRFVVATDQVEVVGPDGKHLGKLPVGVVDIFGTADGFIIWPPLVSSSEAAEPAVEDEADGS